MHSIYRDKCTYYVHVHRHKQTHVSLPCICNIWECLAWSTKYTYTYVYGTGGWRQGDECRHIAVFVYILFHQANNIIQRAPRSHNINRRRTSGKRMNKHTHAHTLRSYTRAHTETLEYFVLLYPCALNVNIHYIPLSKRFFFPIHSFRIFILLFFSFFFLLFLLPATKSLVQITV